MKKITFILVLFFFQNTIAQQDAWVYLTDKPNVASALENPITILTQKALDRKMLHGVSIDARDVPVSTSYLDQLENTNGITVMAKSKWFNAVHVRGSESDILALSSFMFVDSTDFADKGLNKSEKPTQKKYQHTFESDVLIDNFNYGKASNQIEMLNGHELHLQNYTGEGLTIAVLDAGFPSVNTMGSFQRLRANGDLLNGYDFVNRTDAIYDNNTSNHGTLVLSSMAGYIENEYVGTAPDASYYLFITEDATSENPVEESYWVEAAERADSLGVNIINTSLGYTTFDNSNYNYETSDMDGNTAFITKGANIAFEKGLLLITSAGNSGNNSWGIVSAPADAAGVLAVGAVDASGNYASFSSRGSEAQPNQKPDVVAQGAASFLIGTNDMIGTASGTSFSSPILAGGIACLWQVNLARTNAEIMQLVRESASIYNTPTYSLGYGIPNLSTIFSLSVNVLEEKNAFSIFPNPTSGEVKVLFLENEYLTVRIYSVFGKEVFISNIDEFDISFLNDGIYFAHVETESALKIIKLIKF
jgi:serine protease AprX